MPSKKPPAVKLDAGQIEQTRKWILGGASAADVGEAIKTNFPDANAAALMLGAMEGFRDAGNFDPEIVRGWCFEAARDLYRRMVESGDYAAALRAVRDIERMANHVRDETNTRRPQADSEEADADDDGPDHRAIAGET